MISEPPDDAYLRWLYQQVTQVQNKNPSRSYWTLLRQLYTTEFVWFVPNDDNRAEDGRDLRYEFLEETGFPGADEEWLNMGCSMLEMLIALSRRLSFEADGEPRAWFWHIMRNLKLDTMSDAVPYSEEDVDEVLGNVIWRTYKKNGQGGMFPLKHATEDQTQVEIWYQVAAYLTQ